MTTHYKELAFFFAVIVSVALIVKIESLIDSKIVLINQETPNQKEIRAQIIEADKKEMLVNIPDPPLGLDLESALIKNMGSDDYFLKINVDEVWPMASLTKILTAIVALEMYPIEEESMRDIARMMIISSNESAERLARKGGNRASFISFMQKKALSLGMHNTSIFDPSGLSYLNQSSVNDLEKLVAYAVSKHPKIFQISKQQSVTIDGIEYKNINKLSTLPHFLGGKTGYTDEASGNLITLLQYKGQPVLFIVLGTPNQEERFTQTELLYTWISQFFKLSES